MLLWSSSPLRVIHSPFSLSALVFRSCFSRALCSELVGLPTVRALGACILLDCKTWVWGRSLKHSNGSPRYLTTTFSIQSASLEHKTIWDPQRYVYFTLCLHPGDSLFGEELPAASWGWAWQSQEGKAREWGRNLPSSCGEPGEEGRCVTVQRKKGYRKGTLTTRLLRFVSLKTWKYNKCFRPFFT